MGNDKEAKEEECTRGNWDFEGDRQGWRWLVNAVAVIFPVCMREFLRMVWKRQWWTCRVMRVSIGVMSACVLDQILLVNVVCDVNSPSVSVPDCDFVETQIFSFPDKA